MDHKELQDRIKKLGLKSGKRGGTGNMRMRAKRKRPKKPELDIKPEENTQVQENDLQNLDIDTLDQEIENLELQLEEQKIEKQIN